MNTICCKTATMSLFMTATFLMNACTSQKKFTDLQEMGLHGRVKSYTDTYFMLDKELQYLGLKPMETTMEFSEDGHLVKISRKNKQDKDGNMVDNYFATFTSEKGRKSGFKAIDADNKEVEAGRIIWSGDHAYTLTIYKKHNDRTETEVMLDEQGRVNKKSSKEFSDGKMRSEAVIQFFYNKSGDFDSSVSTHGNTDKKVVAKFLPLLYDKFKNPGLIYYMNGQNMKDTLGKSIRVFTYYE